MSVERSQISVLIVEDSPDHRMLMQRKLNDSGMTVRVAATAEEALRQADEVDLVLLDYRLPQMSGMAALEALQDHPTRPSVIMVTGMGSTDIAVEAMRAGAIDYVTKNPGYLQSLPGVVERAWRQHDLARRAGELQRLAVLLNAADSREEVVHEIVAGAKRLLRATTCALALEENGHFRMAEFLGDPSGALDAVLMMPRAELPAPGEAVVHEDSGLLVALPRDDDGPYGVLALFDRDSGDVVDEELELARAFAAFAGIALRNLRRRELEESLISELQQTIEARRDFVASVSHELRTPLTSIGGYAETLLEHWQTLPDDDKLTFLGKVRAHATDLGRLVDQLIDVASLERGRSFRADVRPVPLADAVEEAMRTVEVFVDGRDIGIEVNDHVVLADPALLRRVLANLISNAIKFSDPDSAVEIRAQQQQDRVRVDVQDHGIGLEPREAAHVFDPFWRASFSVANAVRGSGVGLSLVREYVRTMGGDVDVESEPGAGSTFSFTLPAAEAASDEGAAAEAEDDAVHQYR